jgi:hypothetical protein
VLAVAVPILAAVGALALTLAIALLARRIWLSARGPAGAKAS